MNFYIRKGSDLPYLDMAFNGLDKFKLFTNSDIFLRVYTFDMCKILIKCGKVEILEKETCNNCGKSFIVRYKIPKLLTRTENKYLAELHLNTENGKLIMPTNQKLIINVI